MERPAQKRRPFSKARNIKELNVDLIEPSAPSSLPAQAFTVSPWAVSVILPAIT
jgi:hypothetical protein